MIDGSKNPPEPDCASPCDLCGYDLRKDPFGVCPECGSTLHQRQVALAELGAKVRETANRRVAVGCLVAALLIAVAVTVILWWAL